MATSKLDKEVIKEAEESYNKFIKDVSTFEEMFAKENDKEALEEIFELRDKSPTIFAFPVKSTSFKIVCFDVDGFNSIENLPKNSDARFGAVF